MEPGSAPGTLQISLTTLHGGNFEGGHLSRIGTTGGGQAVAVPLYRHEVSLDYTRVEIELQYTIMTDWDVILRLPWERKAQTGTISLIDTATAEQESQMRRNSDVHHRTDTFSGVSDLMLLGRRRWDDVGRAGSALRLSAGVTLPTGDTVENPYLLGAEGREHVHIQFGSGTVDPLLEASYFAPLGSRFTSGAYLTGRFPFYENRRTFRAPPEASTGLSVGYGVSDRVRLRLEAGAYVQGYGYWDGRRDENTGLFSTSLSLGATFHASGFHLGADVRYPLSQRTLAEGDAFQQGPTVSFSVSTALLRR